MKTLNKITITKSDQNRLQPYFNKPNNFDLRDNLKIVEKKLNAAKAVDSKKVPPTVVTMNSKVMVRNVFLRKTFSLELVYPDHVDATNFKISIFSPLGASMFGYSQGDEFIWSGKNGKNKFVIEKIIYQPESAGDYHL